jgi:hypothetical protein
MAEADSVAIMEDIMEGTTAGTMAVALEGMEGAMEAGMEVGIMEAIMVVITEAAIMEAAIIIESMNRLTISKVAMAVAAEEVVVVVEEAKRADEGSLGRCCKTKCDGNRMWCMIPL